MIKLASRLAFGIANSFLVGWAFVLYWSWFIIPPTGWRDITWGEAIGLYWTMSLVRLATVMHGDLGLEAESSNAWWAFEVAKVLMVVLMVPLGWVVVHIYYLTTLRNRFFVLLRWAWSYFRFGRGARLIVGDDDRDAVTAADD